MPTARCQPVLPLSRYVRTVAERVYRHQHVSDVCLPQLDPAWCVSSFAYINLPPLKPLPQILIDRLIANLADEREIRHAHLLLLGRLEDCLFRELRRRLAFGGTSGAGVLFAPCALGYRLERGRFSECGGLEERRRGLLVLIDGRGWCRTISAAAAAAQLFLSSLQVLFVAVLVQAQYRAYALISSAQKTSGRSQRVGTRGMGSCVCCRNSVPPSLAHDDGRP